METNTPPGVTSEGGRTALARLDELEPDEQIAIINACLARHDRPPIAPDALWRDALSRAREYSVGVTSERGEQLLAMLRLGFDAVYELEPAESHAVTDEVLSDLGDLSVACGGPPSESSEPIRAEKRPGPAEIRFWNAEHAANEIAALEAELVTLTTAGTRATQPGDAVPRPWAARRMVRLAALPDPQSLEEHHERWSAAQKRMSEALGITEERWNTADDEERVALRNAAFDAVLNEVRREWRTGPSLEWLRRFYGGTSRVAAVDDLANGMTALASAHRYLASFSGVIRLGIFSFLARLARLFAARGKPFPKLPRLGDWIDVLWDDNTNPKPIARGKKRLGELPPGYPPGSVGGHRMSVMASDFREAWRDIAVALDDIDASARIRDEWMQLMLAAMQSIEPPRSGERVP